MYKDVWVERERESHQRWAPPIGIFLLTAGQFILISLAAADGRSKEGVSKSGGSFLPRFHSFSFFFNNVFQ